MALPKKRVDQVKNVNSIQIMDYLYISYNKVYVIELDNNQVTTMTEYTPELPMDILTNQLEEGQNFAQAGKQNVTDAMTISKGITILNNTGVLPNDIKKWNQKTDNSKTWADSKTHFFWAHKELKTQVIIDINGRYNAAVNHVYCGNTHNTAPAYHTETA